MKKLPHTVFAARRKKFMAAMEKDTLAILINANVKKRSRDVDYPYRSSSDFYYLTGFNEPNAIAVLIPKRAEGEFLLFCQPRDPEQEIWSGPRAGPEDALKIYRANQAYDFAQANTLIPELLLHYKKIYIELANRFDREQLPETPHPWVSQWERQAQQALKKQKSTQRRQPLNDWVNLRPLLHEQRLIKSTEEIKALQKAVDISVKAHRRVMQACRPGDYEYTLEALFTATCLAHGSRAMAYPCIIGNGINSCTLHYQDNDAKLKKGALVLIDAGAEYQYYAADITRTFPVSGSFSPEQKAIYRIVLKAQTAMIKAIKPGATWNDLNTLGIKILTEGLLQLGLLKGTLKTLIKNKSVLQFSLHSFGHWLGMDVHDVGSYTVPKKDKEDKKDKKEESTQRPRPFKAGMVLTMEPGIYIPETALQVEPRWWNIGVRIEDDILVTPQGNRVLSRALPKTIAGIERLMKNKKN